VVWLELALTHEPATIDCHIRPVRRMRVVLFLAHGLAYYLDTHRGEVLVMVRCIRLDGMASHDILGPFHRAAWIRASSGDRKTAARFMSSVSDVHDEVEMRRSILRHLRRQRRC
jgi:hypothetical protein